MRPSQGDEGTSDQLSRIDRMRHGLRRYFHPRLPEVAISWQAFLACAVWYLLASQFVASRVSLFPVEKELKTLTATAVLNPILVLGTLVILWWLSPGLVRSFGLRRDVARSLLLGMLHCLSWVPAVLTINMVVSLLYPNRPVHPAIERLPTADALTLALLWITVALAAPLWEELLFRGLFQTGFYSFLRAGNPPSPNAIAYLSWISIIVAAILFAAAHASQWPDPIPLVVVGLGLGLSFAYSQSLWTPIAFHATFNAINFGLAMLGG
jgi:membrane protease YdiL (CAAX protease family)